MNSLTVDVEDWFHNMFLEDDLPMECWAGLPSVTEQGLDIILDILDAREVSATFFLLGWTVEHHPAVCEKILRSGRHEIGLHGYAHKLVCKQTPESFEEDLEKGLAVVKKYTGIQPLGFRAPVASIDDKSAQWAFPILKRHGLRYDSSIYPANKFVLCGIHGIERKPFCIWEDFWEVPLGVCPTPILDLPVSGGFYLRAYPFCLYRRLLRRMNALHISSVMYVHPWEFCDEFPRKIKNPFWSWTQIYNINENAKKLKILTHEFAFGCIRDYIENNLTLEE